MNILFVLYGDFLSNSANPLSLYARELRAAGHSCAIAVPSNLEDTIKLHENPPFIPILYRDVLATPDSVFPDGRPADVVHACTPREIVRNFVFSYMARRPTPLVVYLEDNEAWISSQVLNVADITGLTDRQVAERLPQYLSHPFRYDCFIGLADAVAVIQEKLKREVPPWVRCQTVMIGVDLELFSPRTADPVLRSRYGIEANEHVIAYHGGLDNFKRSALETLCRAVCLINEKGVPCKLVRTGVRRLDFVDQFAEKDRSKIIDLGLVPRSELPDILALADLFVQPGNIDDFEDLRLPGKVPEFLAMARPVLMPNVNISNLFQDGKDAVLLAAGTAEEIAEKSIALFSDSKSTHEIGKAGRLVAEKYFDVRTQARLLETIYETVCKNFNPVVSAKIWQSSQGSTSVASRLATKLRLLGELSNNDRCLDVGQLLKSYGNLLDLQQQRLLGLETSVNHLNEVVTDQAASLAAIFSSYSWKLTKPLRVVAQPMRSGLRSLLKSFARSATESQFQPRDYTCYGKINVAAMHRMPQFDVMSCTDEALSDATMKSLQGQSYRHWTLRKLNNYQGDYVILLFADDTLTDDALSCLAKEVMKTPSANVIYSDSIGPNGCSNYLPDWNPDLFFTHNYFGLVCIRKTCLRGFGNGSQAAIWAELLRITAGAKGENVRHIAKPLVCLGVRHPLQWREACEVVRDELSNRGLNAEVLPSAEVPGAVRIRWPLPSKVPPLVTLIILTRNCGKLLMGCVNSIRHNTSYPCVEILIVDNGSDDPVVLSFLDDLESNGHARVLRDARPFNFATLNNAAISQACGTILGFVNNDIEVIHDDWLRELVSQAVRPEIGVVGCKLWYPNDTIQHAGVILGIGGVAGHAFVGLPRGNHGYGNRAALVQNLSAVTGACLFMRRSIFQEIGGFDEAFAVAFNDVDLCLRVQSRGYRNLWTPYAELYHYESASRLSDASSLEKQARLSREADMMRQRWGALLQRDPAYNCHLSLSLGCSFMPVRTSSQKRRSSWHW
jgi:GT2 family glycosyltransferase/glycosyltransferase involved in cell wall biosynthesis